MASLTQIQGVTFFNDRNTCIANYNKTSGITYAAQIIKNLGNTFIYAGSLIWQHYTEKSVVTDFTTVPAGGFSKQKLAIFLHGRSSHPGQFDGIVKELLGKPSSDMHIYVPNILKKGKAKLDDMVAPILVEIERWVKNNHDKPLELNVIGISNGGRIARALDAKLGNIKNITKFRLVSIAGACKGSMMANIANTIGLGSVVGEDIRVEMPVNSARNKKLDADWKASIEASPERQRHYVCLAAGLDFHVPNFSSTLLEVPNSKATVQYGILTDHGHNSIVSASAKAVASIVTQSTESTSV